MSKNKATNGYYVQVVKLLKFWRDRLGTDPCNPKSYILEALIHGTIGNPSSHAAAIVNVLEGLEQQLRQLSQHQPRAGHFRSGLYVRQCGKAVARKEFTRFHGAGQICRRGSAQRITTANDEATSRKLWRQIFGSRLRPVRNNDRLSKKTRQSPNIRVPCFLHRRWEASTREKVSTSRRAMRRAVYRYGCLKRHSISFSLKAPAT